MKLRAIAKSYEAIQNILKSLIAATKLTPSIVFRVSPTSIQLIADPPVGSSSPILARCELMKSILFDEYVFNGLSAESNLIYFGLRCESLSKVLHSLQSNMKCLKFKLMNGLDGKFILGIIAEYPTLDSDRIISYQVYVVMINRKFWDTYEDNPLDPIHISLRLPPFKQLISTIERLALLAQYAVTSSKYQNGNGKAYFAIGLSTDTMSIKSKFRDLEPDRSYYDGDSRRDNNGTDEDENSEAFKVRIDIRRLNQVFSALSSMKPTAISCKISNDKAICMHFFNQLTNFKIILPNYDV